VLGSQRFAIFEEKRNVICFLSLRIDVVLDASGLSRSARSLRFRRSPKFLNRRKSTVVFHALQARVLRLGRRKTSKDFPTPTCAFAFLKFHKKRIAGFLRMQSFLIP
jgi:hypothetical protein